MTDQQIAMQPQAMGGMMNNNNNRNNELDRMVKFNQIKFMIQMLKQMYESNDEIEKVLQSALESVLSNNLEQAADSLQVRAWV